MADTNDHEKRKYPLEHDQRLKRLIEAPFTERQNKIFEDIRRFTEPFERYQRSLLDLNNQSLGGISTLSDIIASNDLSIALFKLSASGLAWQVEMDRIHKSWEQAFEPMQRMLSEIRASIAVDFSRITKDLTISASISRALVSLESVDNLEILSGALEHFSMEQASLYEEFRSMIASVKAPNELLNLPFSSITGASREILTSVHAFGTLYPPVRDAIPFDLEQVEENVEEELSDCEALLIRVNPDLIKLHRGAIEAFQSRSPDKARQVLISLRELWTHLLHALAPTENVLAWADPNDRSLIEKGKPTRRARALYVCRGARSDELSHFLDKDTSAMVALFDVFNRVHEVKVELSDRQLNALLLRSKSNIVYLINLHTEIQ